MVKKLMVFLLVLVLLLALPINAMAQRPQMDTRTYLNLGDSIARGTGVDPLNAYFNGYSDYLNGYGFEGSSMAFDGVTSSCILNGLLYMDWMQAAVKDADVITISIGGNNVLQPMVGAMMMYYELNPFEASVEELLAAIIDRGADYWYWVTQALLEKLMYADVDECPLWQGVFQFQKDWPRIIEAIHELNPEAHIIVLSIYNPVSKLESPELYQLMEELIHPMNQTMRRHQGRRVSVANVYNAFRWDEEAVGFSVLWRPNLDPHPTIHGHQLIAEELMRVRNPRAFR